MKGLSSGNHYLINSMNHKRLVLVGIAVSLACALLTSVWVLTVIATVVAGMISLNRINSDTKSDNRNKAGILPVTEVNDEAVISCVDRKYAMFIALSLIGLLLGLAASLILSLMLNRFDHEDMLIFSGMSIEMALLSGCVAIPCAFLFNEDVSKLSMVIVYPASIIAFSGMMMFCSANVTWCVGSCLSIVLYIISWNFARNTLTGIGRK